MAEKLPPELKRDIALMAWQDQHDPNLAGIRAQKAEKQSMSSIDDLVEEMKEANRMLAKAQEKGQYSPEYRQYLDTKANTRKPSKAGKIGMGPSTKGAAFNGQNRLRGKLPSRVADALYGGDKGKLGSLVAAFSYMSERDPRAYMKGAEILEDMGWHRNDLPDLTTGYALSALLGGKVGQDPSGGYNKATLGTTGTTGGYVLPNNLVDRVIKPQTQRVVYSNLVTTISGVAVRGVDQPFRLGTPPRATFQDWGQTKENLNETYGSYTATLGTLARVYDISKQYARFSAGSAEADVMDELTKAIALGENYYLIAGAGTGTVGSGDPTLGVYTALAAAASFNGYTTSFSSASQSTLVGSFAAAVAQAAGTMAQRNRVPEAIVVDAVTYWDLIPQGTDTAGFWLSLNTGIPGAFTSNQSGGVSMWGIPIYYDSNLTTNSASKIAILGEWSSAKLYRGMEFRVDTSDQAGTRWDQNLIGFRGEEEIGFHAGPAVNTGAFQLITTAVA